MTIGHILKVIRHYWLRPTLLLALVAISTWTLSIRLAYQELLSPPSLLFVPSPIHKAVGFGIIVSNTTLLLLWLIPWAYCVALGATHARTWRPNPVHKRIVQTSAPGDRTFRDIPTSRRTCPVCGVVGDRTYHCTNLNRCLPLYDHYCGFQVAPVYLASRKAYLNWTLWLSVHCFYMVGVILWASFGLRTLHLLVVLPSAIFPGLFALFFSTFVAGFQFWSLAVRNNLMAEARFYPVLSARVGGRRTEFTHQTNPWDRGVWENLRFTLGHSAWTWFLWFWPSPEVRYFGTASREGDLPWGEVVRQQERDLELSPWLTRAIATRAARATGSDSTGLSSDGRQQDARSRPSRWTET